MTQKKSTPKKAPKPVQRVERVERVASKKRARLPFSSSKEESDGRKRVERVASKKRTRSPSSSEEEEKRNKKEKKNNKNKLLILHENCAAETKGSGSKVDLVSDRLIFLLI